MIDLRTKDRPAQPGARGFFWILVLFGLFIAPTNSLQAQVAAILDEIPDRARTELLDQRSVSRTHADAKDLELGPRFPGVNDAIAELREIGTNIVSERLILVDGPVDDTGLVSVLNALLGVSELAYLEYYNPLIDKWKDLFKESYRVDNEDTSTRNRIFRSERFPAPLKFPCCKACRRLVTCCNVSIRRGIPQRYRRVPFFQ